jgi:cell division protein FtsW
VPGHGVLKMGEISNMKQYKFVNILLVTSLIFAIGLVMIFSTTSAEVLDHDLEKSTTQALWRQIFNAGIGIILAFCVWKVGFRQLLRWSPLLLAFFILLLTIVLIPGIGTKVNGSRRWIVLAGFSFQPSEFVKYVVPLYFIHRFSYFENSLLSFKDFLKLVAICCLPILLIVVEPNNGTAGVIGVTLIMLFLMTGIRFKYWALPLLIFMLVGAAFAYHSPYVFARLKVYLHPELDLKGKGHQPYQAKIATGSGQLWGKGPGNSLQKLSYLPEAQNDYIAAIYAEEFGFIGMFVLIALYACLACIGFSIAGLQRERQGFYLAGAVTFLICFQAFLNLGVVSGLLPSTGLNLPFFSQGGSSLMANLMGIGILFSIAQPQNSLLED